MLTNAHTKGSPLSLGERGVTFDIALALLTGLGIALAKRTLDFHLGIPGHSGASWIAVMVLGALVNRRKGMTLLAGASVGLWGAPIGLHQTILHNSMLFATSAAAIELALVLRLPIANPVGAAVIGGVAHMAKFGYIFSAAAGTAVIKHFEILGTTIALRNHLLFGIVGGLVAWAIYNAGKSLTQDKPENHRA